MKVKMGPYKNWIGPYQLVNLLQKVGVSEDRCGELGKWLADTQLSTFCNWIDNKRLRNIQVRIDKYDTWSMDSTLAYIILPMLKQLKETEHGAPNIDDKDVPKKLRSTSAPVKGNEWDTDDNWFDRWDWVLDEMIWTFSQVNHEELFMNDNNTDSYGKRMKNGFRLFGKYYSGLWD